MIRRGGGRRRPRKGGGRAGGGGQAGGGGGGAGAQNINQPAADWSLAPHCTQAVASPPSAVMVVKFTRPVVWSGGIPVNWRMSGSTPLGLVSAVNVLDQQTVQLQWTSNVLTSKTLTIPQHDPTFRGERGGEVQPGIFPIGAPGS